MANETIFKSTGKLSFTRWKKRRGPKEYTREGKGGQQKKMKSRDGNNKSHKILLLIYPQVHIDVPCQ